VVRIQTTHKNLQHPMTIDISIEYKLYVPRKDILLKNMYLYSLYYFTSIFSTNHFNMEECNFYTSIEFSPKQSIIELV